MKIVLFLVLLIMSSCRSVGSQTKIKEENDTFIFTSPLLERKLDSLMAFVDDLEEYDLTYCTIMFEPKDSIGLLTLFISNGSVARLTESSETFKKQKEMISLYGGLAIKTDTNSIIMIDSLSYDYLKSYIKNDTFSPSLYERSLMKLSHQIPHKWVFEIKEGTGGIEMRSFSSPSLPYLGKDGHGSSQIQHE